jgi:transposase
MLFTWRRRYLAEQQAQSAGLIPVVLVSDTPAEVVASSPVEPRVPDTKPVTPAGTIEIRIGRAVVKVDGLVDADMLRIVLGTWLTTPELEVYPRDRWSPHHGTPKDQLTHFYAQHRNIANCNELFMELVRDGLSGEELARISNAGLACGRDLRVSLTSYPAHHPLPDGHKPRPNGTGYLCRISPLT